MNVIKDKIFEGRILDLGEQNVDNNSKASDSNVPKHQNEALETKIVMLMKTNKKIKQTEIAEELKVSRATVQRTIQVLVEKNTIERVGGKRYGSWQVNIQYVTFNSKTLDLIEAEIEIKENGIVDAPNTGDTTNPLWFILLLVSGAGIILTVKSKYALKKED